MKLKKLGITFLVLACFSCGERVVEKTSDNPSPGPGTDPGTDPGDDPDTGTKISYQKMQTYLANYCQSCHATAQFMQGENALRASQAKNYLWSKKMPPSNAPKALPDNVRTEMLTFF